MIVFAINIHTGGGKILLDELITSQPFGRITHLFLDERYQCPYIADDVTVYRCRPRLISRILAQFSLRTLVKSLPSGHEPTILFFGNYPPFFKLKAKSILYLQNCFLLSGVPLPRGSVKETIRNLIERYLLKIFRSYFNEIWVQTDWMVSLVKEQFGEKRIFKKPFLPKFPAPVECEKKYDFITVTSLSPHKNFNTFVAALKIMDRQLSKGISAVAVLDSDLIHDQVAQLRFSHIDLKIRTKVSREELFQIYQQCKVAVITSSLESFCLPLYEAGHYGLNIVALDTPFAREWRSKISFYESNTGDVLADAMLRNV